MILLTVWKQQPGRFFCISSKARDGKWTDHFFRPADFSKIKPFIDANLDKDLYWCPHGFNKPRRLKRYAEIPKLLWADLDEVNPHELTDFLPTVAWESSPGRFAALWVLDDFMNEDLNRRLTYHLKADPGGWDLTQVLRIPDTVNYKYVSTPKVRLRWADGPSYTVAALTKLLPAERKRKETDVALGIYKKYEKNLPGSVRRTLLKGKPQVGKRSQVLWSLVHSLIEAGASHDEAFELLRVSPWNKFSKRRDGDEQLRREIEKATKQHFQVDNDEEPGEDRFGDEPEEDPVEEEEYKFLAKSMADVVEEEVDWVWYPYLARGEVTILEGDPGLGKSFLAQMVAKGICDGERLPSVRRLPSIQGRVAYFDIENSSATVTKKRLVWNDCKRLDNFYQEEEPFSIDDEETIDKVYAAVDKLRPTLVVFDTLNTYIGTADTHKAAETQQAFKRFIDIARRFKCSVMVLRHLTKSSKERALYRGQGSIAFTGLARVVVTVGLSPDDDDVRVMAVTKLNITRIPKALTFSIEDMGHDKGKFNWGDFVDLSSDEIVSTKPSNGHSNGNGKNGHGEEDMAVAWLKGVLGDGPVEFAKLKMMGEPKAISEKALHRAALAMGIIRDDGWWGMPT